MRLFVAIDPEDAIRERIARFLESMKVSAPDARWVQPESLHVTLKFIGERQEAEVESIKAALEMVRASAFNLDFRGCGYFPTTRSARVFWIGVESEGGLAALAAAVDERLGHLEIPKEEHPFNPHLTLARSPGSRPHGDGGKTAGRTFQHLQQKLEGLPAPEFGVMKAREFFLYRSQLSPRGSKYTKLATFVLP